MKKTFLSLILFAALASPAICYSGNDRSELEREAMSYGISLYVPGSSPREKKDFRQLELEVIEKRREKEDLVLQAYELGIDSGENKSIIQLKSYIRLRQREIRQEQEEYRIDSTKTQNTKRSSSTKKAEATKLIETKQSVWQPAKIAYDKIVAEVPWKTSAALPGLKIATVYPKHPRSGTYEVIASYVDENAIDSKFYGPALTVEIYSHHVVERDRIGERTAYLSDFGLDGKIDAVIQGGVNYPIYADQMPQSAIEEYSILYRSLVMWYVRNGDTP